ncbi:MAG: protein-S-isoprenylcysteine O-methyltransferase Ste14 [Pseudohongiellaceae bacterium]
MLGLAATVIALVTFADPTLPSCALGLPFMALGLWWRVWSAGHLVKNVQLIVSGPYRYVQNPLYFGRLCLLTGLCLSARLVLNIDGSELPMHWLALSAGWLLFFFYYLPRKKRVEGRRLATIHGQAYDEWAAAVPLIFPRFTPWGSDTTPWSGERFGQMRELPFVLTIAAVGVALFVRAVVG